MVYSINGKLITKQELYFRLINPIIIKDLNSDEFLCYIGKGSIYIYSLPYLDLRANVDVQQDEEIFNIFPNHDKTILYCLNKSGNKVYIIKDEVKN